MAQTEFIELIAPHIALYANGKYSISAIIAQACCESRYGESTLSKKYYNYFGLKCGKYWNGASVNLKTKEEYKKGFPIIITDNFRIYENMKNGVKGYFDFINTSRYKNLVGVTSPTTYLNRIKQDGYCTSSSYVETCKKIIITYKLTDYDFAYKVLRGQYGNGEERKKRVENLGYDYLKIQKIVNSYVKMGVK